MVWTVNTLARVRSNAASRKLICPPAVKDVNVQIPHVERSNRSPKEEDLNRRLVAHYLGTSGLLFNRQGVRDKAETDTLPTSPPLLSSTTRSTVVPKGYESFKCTAEASPTNALSTFFARPLASLIDQAVYSDKTPGNGVPACLPVAPAAQHWLSIITKPDYPADSSESFKKLELPIKVVDLFIDPSTTTGGTIPASLPRTPFINRAFQKSEPTSSDTLSHTDPEVLQSAEGQVNADAEDTENQKGEVVDTTTDALEDSEKQLVSTFIPSGPRSDYNCGQGPLSEKDFDLFESRGDFLSRADLGMLEWRDASSCDSTDSEAEVDSVDLLQDISNPKTGSSISSSDPSNAASETSTVDHASILLSKYSIDSDKTTLPFPNEDLSNLDRRPPQKWVFGLPAAVIRNQEARAKSMPSDNAAPAAASNNRKTSISGLFRRKSNTTRSTPVVTTPKPSKNGENQFSSEEGPFSDPALVIRSQGERNKAVISDEAAPTTLSNDEKTSASKVFRRKSNDAPFTPVVSATISDETTPAVSSGSKNTAAFEPLPSSSNGVPSSSAPIALEASQVGDNHRSPDSQPIHVPAGAAQRHEERAKAKAHSTTPEDTSTPVSFPSSPKSVPSSSHPTTSGTSAAQISEPSRAEKEVEALQTLPPKPTPIAVAVEDRPKPDAEAKGSSPVAIVGDNPMPDAEVSKASGLARETPNTTVEPTASAPPAEQAPPRVATEDSQMPDAEPPKSPAPATKPLLELNGPRAPMTEQIAPVVAIKDNPMPDAEPLRTPPPAKKPALTLRPPRAPTTEQTPPAAAVVDLPMPTAKESHAYAPAKSSPLAVTGHSPPCAPTTAHTLPPVGNQMPDEVIEPPAPARKPMLTLTCKPPPSEPTTKQDPPAMEQQTESSTWGTAESKIETSGTVAVQGNPPRSTVQPFTLAANAVLQSTPPVDTPNNAGLLEDPDRMDYAYVSEDEPGVAFNGGEPNVDFNGDVEMTYIEHDSGYISNQMNIGEMDIDEMDIDKMDIDTIAPQTRSKIDMARLLYRVKRRDYMKKFRLTRREEENVHKLYKTNETPNAISIKSSPRVMKPYRWIRLQKENLKQTIQKVSKGKQLLEPCKCKIGGVYQGHYRPYMCHQSLETKMDEGWPASAFGNYEPCSLDDD